MPDEKLASYIKEQVAKGVGRAEIAKALIASGWQVQDVNNALISLSVPMEGGSAPAMPAPLSAGSSPLVSATAPLNQGPPQQPHIPTTAPAPFGGDATQLPSATELLSRGYAIYREQFGTIISLAALPVVFSLLSSIVSATLGSPTGGINFGLIFLIIIIGIATIIITILTSVALLHAIRAHTEHLSFKEALSRGWNQFGSYFWLQIVSGCVGCGYGFVYVLLPAGIVATLFYFLNTAIGIPSLVLFILGGILFVILFVIVVSIIAAWFASSVYVLVDGSGRGLSALAESRLLVAGRVGPVARRYAVLVIFVIIAAIAVFIVPSLIVNLFLPKAVAQIVMSVINGFLSYGLLGPVFSAAVFSLYVVLKQTAPGSDPVLVQKGRSKLIVFAWLGLLVPIAGIISAVMLASLNTARSLGNTAAFESNVSQLEVQLELYNAEHNTYPNSLSDLSSPPTNLINPRTHLPVTYSVLDGGKSYSLCGLSTTGSTPTLTSLPDCYSPSAAQPAGVPRQ